MMAKEPFVITGMTEHWTALQNWKKEAFLAKHGDEPYQLHPHGNDTVATLLAWRGKYHMVCTPQACIRMDGFAYLPCAHLYCHCASCHVHLGKDVDMCMAWHMAGPRGLSAEWVLLGPLAAVLADAIRCPWR